VQKRIWLKLVCCLVLVGFLAACGSAPSQPVDSQGSSTGQDTAIPMSPTPEPTPVLGVEAVAPLSHYRLTLDLDTVRQRVTGQEQVTFPNRTGVPLDEIVFRLYPNLPQYGGAMRIGSVRVNGESGDLTFRASNTALAIALPEPLLPEASASIDLTFDVDIPEKDSGYVLFGYSQGIWSLPDVYPLLAVHDGAAWHEDIAPAHGDAVFAEAAFYDVELTIPADLHPVFTGSVESDALGQNGRRVLHVAGGPFREFAFLASADYQSDTATSHGIILRSCFLPGDDAAGQATLNIAAAALRAYEDEFGPYPFPEIVVAEAPLLNYGMELPGLNLIGIELYRDQRAELENRVVHEIAHQWWYAQVGNDQVNTPWLDEGLAEYSMAIYYKQALGEARMNTLINQRWLVPYQVAIDNGYDAVVNQPASAFNWEYEVIVYAKAALFFDALHQKLGDTSFKAVLHEYVDRYRWRIATPEEFLNVTESVSGQDVDSLYNHWILAKQ
jgi:aminopeptidase N